MEWGGGGYSWVLGVGERKDLSVGMSVEKVKFPSTLKRFYQSVRVKQKSKKAKKQKRLMD